MKDEKQKKTIVNAELDDEQLDQAVGGGGSGRTHMPPDVVPPVIPGINPGAPGEDGNPVPEPLPLGPNFF